MHMKATTRKRCFWESQGDCGEENSKDKTNNWSFGIIYQTSDLAPNFAVATTKPLFMGDKSIGGTNVAFEGWTKSRGMSC